MRALCTPRARADSDRRDPRPASRRAPSPRPPEADAPAPPEALERCRGLEAGRGPVRTFLVVDQAMVRAGVHRLLEQRGRYRVVGEASDPLDALPRLSSTLTELVLCAFYREASPALARLAPLKLAAPGCRVLLLEEHDSPAARAAFLEGGVDAVLPAGAAADELLLALDSIRRGYPYLSPRLIAQRRAAPDDEPEARQRGAR